MNNNNSGLKTIDVIAGVLVIVGALNWGLVGFANFNLVAAIFGEATVLSRVIYAVVGLAAIWEVIQVRGLRRRWAAEPGGPKRKPTAA